MTETYPRRLRPKERELLEFVLPAGSPGYGEYRAHIAKMVVLGEGRRGPGNVVLGNEGDVPDISSPLPPVIAYGVVETTRDMFTITVRECVGDQIDVEIVSSRGEEIPDHFEEKRRWTYSTWKPREISPASHSAVREVRINETLVLAIAEKDKRLWLHDAARAMNHLIPITNYYNELMLHKAIRDPKVALKSNLLFDELAKYSDEDLRSAFVAYNRVHKKVDLKVEVSSPPETGMKTIVSRLLGKDRKPEP
ncbi:MAG: hypothetical protein HY961_06595 [Ignavibacteriae bacterium]|nr:hypothetical protein [Ignavibacteriota bacterium]